jgi:outer membrane protein OmpA-like peptidoglycan-associated protein
MTMSLSSLRIFKASAPLAALLLGGFMWGADTQPAAAEDMSAEQLIEALTPPPATRGLTPIEQPEASQADPAFIETVQARARSLTPLSPDERDQVAALKSRPNASVHVYFDFNSAAITPRAESQLNEIIGKALSASKFGRTVFVLGGHTDAVGGDEYNQRLSERRANAVKSYLMAKFKIPAENLATAGFGKRDLMDPAHPNAGENRRVQIVNLGTSNQAQR